MAQNIGWLWRRIKEALPRLETYGIRAERLFVGRGSDKQRVIVLRGVSSGDSKIDLLTDQNPDRNAVGSIGHSGDSKTSKPNSPIPGTRKRLKGSRGTNRAREEPCESTVPTDPYCTHAIGKPNRGDSNTKSTVPAIDDPYLWEQVYIPELDTVGPRLLTEDLLPPPPSPEYVPQPRATSIRHEWTIEPDSVCATAIRGLGIRQWRKARNLIREYRADWEGYPLPTDAQGWKDLFEHGEGVFFTLDAVEEGLEAA